MVSKQEFEAIVEALKQEKPHLFSIKEDGTLEVNLFVLQEVLKKLGYQVKYDYFWKDNAYCIDFKLIKEGKPVYETVLCRDGLSKEKASFDVITGVEIALLERSLSQAFKQHFNINI